MRVVDRVARVFLHKGSSTTSQRGGPRPGPPEASPKTLSNTVLRGFSIIAASRTAEGVIHIIVLMVLARVLPPAAFGAMSGVLIILGIATMSYQLGVGPALIQRQTLTTDHVNVAFWFTQAFALSLSALVFVTADALEALLRISELSNYVRLAAALFIIEGVGVVPLALLSREMRFSYLAGIKVFSYTIGYGITAIVLAHSGLGVWSLVWAHLVQAAIHSTLALYGRPLPLRARFSFQAWKDLVVFGVGLTLGRLANYSATQGDNFIVARYLGADALGLYGRAYQILMLPAILVGRVLDSVLFPVLSSIQTDTERVLLAFNRAISSIAVVVMPLSVVCFFAAREIILVLLGAEWTGAVVPFRILALAMFCRTAYKIGDSAARALGLVYRRAWRQVIYGVLVIAGTFVGARFGIAGIAAGVLVAVAVNYLLMCELCYSRLSGSWLPFLRAHVPGLVLAVATSAVTGPVVVAGRHLHVPPAVTLTASAFTAMAASVLTVVISSPLTADRPEWRPARALVDRIRYFRRRAAPEFANG